jgi:hypothetical protein
MAKSGRSWILACRTAALLAALGAGIGCTATIGNGPSGDDGPGTDTVPGQSTGQPPQIGACQGHFTVPTRLARIADSQIANAISDLFGAGALAGVTVADPKTRDFIPTQDTLNSTILDKYVQTAEGAMNAVTDDSLATLGGCSPATFNDACAKSAISAIATKAYRRPVTPDELDSLMTVYTETSTYGVAAATRAALRAVLTAPPTIYRTEFGAVAQNGTTHLTSYEVASELSFMLADTIPDDTLLAAAKAGTLNGADQIVAQVNRLLGTSRVQQNLTRVMLANFAVGSLFGTTKDTKLFPAYTTGLETSMFTETQMFLDNVLWHGKVADILSSRQTYIDPTLAALYNVSYPGPMGGGFVPHTFGTTERAGLLTQGSTLAIAANPDNTSVVHRGLFVHGKLMCLGVTPPPSNLAAQINALSTANITEKQKANIRATTSPCNGCHLGFDPYGLTMEKFDAIGRYREAYPDGTRIDSSVTLPQDLDGISVQGVTDMADALASNPIFASCMTEKLIGYAIGFELDSSASTDCGVVNTYNAFAKSGSGTFSDMIRAISTSDILTVRNTEAQQ